MLESFCVSFSCNFMSCSGCPSLHGVNPNNKAIQTAKIRKIGLLSFSPLIFNRRFTNSKANSYSPLLDNDLGPLDIKSDYLTIRPRVFQSVLRGEWGEGRYWKFCWGDFLTRWLEPVEEWFWAFKPFSKLKTAFCEY